MNNTSGIKGMLLSVECWVNVGWWRCCYIIYLEKLLVKKTL